MENEPIKDSEEVNDYKLEVRAFFGNQDAINAINAQKLITKSVKFGIPLTFEKQLLCGRLLHIGRETNQTWEI